MENELKNQIEAVQASNGGLLAVEQFLQNNYLFRRNVLSGKIEFATLPRSSSSMGRTEPRGSSLLSLAWSLNGATPLFVCLAALGSGSLATDGHAARQ